MSSHEEHIIYEKKPFPKQVVTIGAILTAIGLILGIAAYMVEPLRANFNTIIAFMFLTSIGFGSLFIVALEYLAGASWSTPFRRVTEIFALLVFVAWIFAIPGFLNLHGLFHWSHAEVVAKDAILKGKSPYLNSTFFIVRTIAIFALGMLFYKLIVGNSNKQDLSKDQNLTRKNIKLSAIFMPVFAISITLLAIDWMMSLEPHWFSTIYGVYYFAGSFLAALSALAFTAITLNEKGLLAKGLTKDHYYSLGALIFGFTNFWAYIAFSQFLLIWYANLPEETFWFINRWEGSWKFVSIGIIFIRFVVPYITLLTQPSKMNPKRLKFAALWILASHFYDLYWLIMPTYSKLGCVFGWMEISFPILAIGVVILVFGLAAKNKNLVPIGDPKLKSGMDFRL